MYPAANRTNNIPQYSILLKLTDPVEHQHEIKQDPSKQTICLW